MSARLRYNKTEFSHKYHLLMFTEQESKIKIGTSREKRMCFRLKRKGNRPRRIQFLILQLSPDKGCLVLGSLAPSERPGWGLEGAAEGGRSYWKDARMGREAFGKGLVRRKKSSEGKR